MESRVTTAALARTADKRFFGVAPAIVTNNEDPEKRGRIKVKFPWFNSSMESDWCRVAQLYAGNGYGSLWIPELDDEVIVAFEHGDMRFPIVLGGVHNGVDTPSSFRDATTDQKLFRTKAGHQLLFDDSSGKNCVTLETAGGHTVTLDDVSRDVTIETSTGQSITLAASGAMTIKATTSVTVNAPAINLGSPATSSLVLGEQLLKAFNMHTHNCTAPGTPSGPPVPPMLPDVLSTKNKTA
jgi:uncharacterized protein involved in type VI secretion and phage assembly